MSEDLIRGVKGLAAYLGMSERTVKRKLPQLRECGAVFYVMTGSPPHRELRAWKSVIKAWTIRKGADGENV